jgi:hypothetical protein
MKISTNVSNKIMVSSISKSWELNFKYVLSIFLVALMFSVNSINAQTLFDDDDEDETDSTETSMFEFNSDKKIYGTSFR